MGLSNTRIATCILLVSAAATVNAGDEIAPPQASMAAFCTALPRSEYSSFEKVKVRSEWFEVYKIAPGVTAIYEPHQWQEVISYLIEGEESALLFDTGNGIGDIKSIVDELTTKPTSVLNSHTHYDHVGGNYAFEAVYGMDTRFTKRRQKGHGNSAIAIEVSDQALCKGLPKGVSVNSHVGRPFEVTEFIADGYKFDLGDRTLEVMHIPGHTPDAIALIDRQHGLMWTGDSYYSGPIWLYAEETDLQAYANSLDRLIIEVPKLTALLPAHNTPWVKPDVLLRVRQNFQAMLEGKSKKDFQGDGMVEHRFNDESPFSFLMRDEPLPYTKPQ